MFVGLVATPLMVPADYCDGVVVQVCDLAVTMTGYYINYYIP